MGNGSGRSFDVLGLAKSEAVLRALQATVRDPAQKRALDPVIKFASVARQNLDLAGPLLESVGNPIKVQSKVISGSTPLGAFAAAVAVAVTLMLITVLLAAGSLALEREENAFRRLV